jgi:hypothetical protein
MDELPSKMMNLAYRVAHNRQVLHQLPLSVWELRSSWGLAFLRSPVSYWPEVSSQLLPSNFAVSDALVAQQLQILVRTISRFLTEANNISSLRPHQISLCEGPDCPRAGDRQDTSELPRPSDSLGFFGLPGLKLRFRAGTGEWRRSVILL